MVKFHEAVKPKSAHMLNYFPVVRASFTASDAVQQKLCRRLLDVKKIKEISATEALEMAILGYEMQPTYTFGRRQRGKQPPDLMKHLENNCRGASVLETLRGGFATFHGPGQLVLYPVLDLQRLGIKIRDYICILEKSIMSTLQHKYKISTEQRPGAGFNGVWIKNENKKVASVGVHVRRNVTSHGLALNVDMDPFWFRQIVPCNLSNVDMTSMKDHLGISTELRVSSVGKQLSQEIARRLGVPLTIRSIEEARRLLIEASLTH